MNSNYKVIGTFEYVADAELLKTRLEAEGIPVLLKDANIMQAEPFIATAIGGVKVMVPGENEALARSLYDEVRAYAQDDAGNPLKCPNCQAARMERYLRPKGVWYRLFPFLEPRKYVCLECGMISKP
ncbi:DUF2007 domain-containing protein [Robiginitalea sp. M366]|uniref:putative signal transducing protein n=1 Tax=Robiginitalea aestuariiviva TaxID=3036903 RepID=UPI00240D24D5|nr:DUF2007 domain-containing protein [Robiginitalea aestuariiviva]MDG1571701.1 DUF2007 domain-containing protein [Robiginitalea aestuariiviva]